MPVNFQQSGVDISSRFVPKSVFGEGQLWAAGANYNAGVLGVGSALAAGGKTSSPIQVATGGLDWSSRPYGIAGLRGTGAGLKTDGTLWTWGKNNYGNTGHNDTTNRSTPTQVGSDKTWAKIAGGTYGTYAGIKTDGSCWMWGTNTYGHLGDGTTVSKSSPVLVQGPGSAYMWKYVTGNSQATYGIKSDGTAWVWGRNWLASLGGLGSVISSPVQIGTNTNWKQIQGLYDGGAIALKTDGTLWAWDYYNTFGQVGNGTSTSQTSPVQIGSDTTWRSLSLSSQARSPGAIKTDGTLWMWGRGGEGQTGQNNNTHYSSPVQVIGGGTTWKYFGTAGTVWAVKTDGTMWVWGQNYYGQLGVGTRTAYSSPVQLGSASDKWVYAAQGYSPGSTWFLKSVE